MAYGYGRTNKPIDVTEFLIKRWANLYPLYIVTVLAGASSLVSSLSSSGWPHSHHAVLA